MKARLAIVLVAGMVAALFAGGCAAGGPGELAIGPGDYPAAFEAAREVIRDARFDIDRVDARAGVITSAPRVSTGIALPWDMAGSTPARQLGDLLNRHARRIRVTFEPAGAAGEEAAGRPDLLATEPMGLVMRVRVLVEREQRPGWRLESTAVQLSGRARDPELERRGMQPGYTVVLREDPDLSGKLAARIAERMEEMAAGRLGAR